MFSKYFEDTYLFQYESELFSHGQIEGQDVFGCTIKSWRVG